MNSASVVAVTLMLLVGGSSAQPKPAADFAFRFTSSTCTTRTLDTFKGTYLEGRGREPISIPLTLSPPQMAAIFEAIVKIDFFAYPEHFKGVREGGLRSMTEPSTTYHLEVRNAGIVHEVTWNNGEGPWSEPADRLSTLFKLIDRFIGNHPAVKRLPPLDIACM